MAYSIDRANEVADVLERFTDAYAHLVAGMFVNLDYWMAEAWSAVEGLDGYEDRFRKLSAGQADWVERYETRIGVYCPYCDGRCEFDNEELHKPEPPRRVPLKQRNVARKRLVESVYHFLIRGFRQGLVSRRELEMLCERFDTSIDFEDLRRAEKQRRMRSEYSSGRD